MALIVSKACVFLVSVLFVFSEIAPSSEAAPTSPASLAQGPPGPVLPAFIQIQPKQRYARSCGNEMLHSILHACNKNHKRSPFVMNFIFVEYYQQQPSDTNNEQINGGSADSFLDPRVSPWVLENEEVFMVMSLQDDPVSRNGEVDLVESGDQHNDIRTLPRRSAYIRSIMEKCCTTGCSPVDFTNFC